MTCSVICFILLLTTLPNKIDADDYLPLRTEISEIKEGGEMCEDVTKIPNDWISKFKASCSSLLWKEDGSEAVFKFQLKQSSKSPQLFFVFIQGPRTSFYFKTVIITAISSSMKYIGKFTSATLSTGDTCDLPTESKMMIQTQTIKCSPGPGEAAFWTNPNPPKTTKKVMFHFQLSKEDYDIVQPSGSNSAKKRFYFIAYIGGEGDCYLGRRSPIYSVTKEGHDSVFCDEQQSSIQQPTVRSPYNHKGEPQYFSSRWDRNSVKHTTTTKATTMRKTKTTTTTVSTTTTTTMPVVDETTSMIASKGTTTTKSSQISGQSTKKSPFEITTSSVTRSSLPNFKSSLRPVSQGPIIPIIRPREEEEKITGNEIEEHLTVPEIYEDCGKKKGCVGDPVDCIPNKSCQSVISYGEDAYRVKIMGKSGKYIAVALSRDYNMGNDSVVECVRESGDKINAYVSWNYHRDNKREKGQAGISQVRGSYTDGFIICEFWRYRMTEYQGVPFDLNKDKFFILHARGNSAVDGINGNIGYHDEGTSFTKEKYKLNKRFVKRKYGVIFERLHGALLITAWNFCFPLGAFISRYYKETYMKGGIRGFTIWYSWHTILSWIGTTMTVLAVVGLYLVSEKLGGWNYHRITGVALIVIMIVQIITGYAIRGLNCKISCQFCNYVHGLLGHSSFFLSLANMFDTIGIENGLPCSAFTVLIIWIIFYMLTHLVMSYQVCYVDFIRGTNVSRAYNCFKIKNIPHPRNEDVPGSPIRKLILTIFIVFSVMFNVALIVMSSTSEEICSQSKHNSD